MMKSNEDMKEFAESMPEEFAVDLGKIVQTLDGRMEECLEILEDAIQAAYHLSPKELGLQFPKSTKKDSLVEIHIPSNKAEEEKEDTVVVIPTWTLPFLFQSRKKEFQNGASMLQLIRDPPTGNINAQRYREKVFDMFRPINNSLNGYSPAGVTNRFVDRLDENKRFNQATVVP
mmetsp:Transcript_46104/g.111697  ORF Transcript_46104/g.111697 Transcript_46104/m.111697 type:complete len:174 (-) Transcript_46104:448-969(-)